mgnify:CR=1 FL=1
MRWKPQVVDFSLLDAFLEQWRLTELITLLALKSCASGKHLGGALEELLDGDIQIRQVLLLNTWHCRTTFDNRFGLVVALRRSLIEEALVGI